jgi:hypothetical protein
MKSWALVVVGLYVLVLAVLAVPVVLLAFAPKLSAKEAGEAFLHWESWLWLGVMGLAQAALLVVPVRVASRRPVTRRSLLWPVVTAGLMMGALAVGAIYSLWEYILQDKGTADWIGWAAIVAGVAIWIAWAVLFYRASHAAAPADVITRQCRLMLRGSVLELLIAVPTHIVARSRDYCCAGFATFLGLTLGLSVMLFSYGPAVFFLYADRWRRLRPGSS